MLLLVESYSMILQLLLENNDLAFYFPVCDVRYRDPSRFILQIDGTKK